MWCQHENSFRWFHELFGEITHELRTSQTANGKKVHFLLSFIIVSRFAFTNNIALGLLIVDDKNDAISEITFGTSTSSIVDVLRQ